MSNTRERGITELGLIADFVMGQSPDSKYVSSSQTDGFPFIQGSGEFGPFSPYSHQTCTLPKKICNIGDCLISVRAPVGDLNIADRQYCIGRGIAAIRFKSCTHSKFGFYLLSQYASFLRRVSQGSTFEAIGNRELATLRVPVIDADAQRRIAVILDTADVAIAKTKTLVAKLKQMKAGLLHDLYTRGITENGELREPYPIAPQLYQPSPVGWMPKEWDIESGQSLTFPITKGTTPKVMHDRYEAGRVPYLRVQNLSFDGSLFFDDDRLFIDQSVHDAELKRSKVYPGDVLMNLVGPPLGKVSLVPNTFSEWNLNQAIAIFRTLGRCSPIFLASYLQTHHAMKWLLSNSRKTSGQQNLTLDMCRFLPVPIPKSNLEQKAICDRIVSHETRICREETTLRKLNCLKQGLMNDLLSGKRTVIETSSAVH